MLEVYGSFGHLERLTLQHADTYDNALEGRLARPLVYPDDGGAQTTVPPAAGDGSPRIS